MEPAPQTTSNRTAERPVNPVNSTRWKDALVLVDRIDCTIGNALTLLSGGSFKGEKLDYWHNEYMTPDEARNDQHEREHQNWIRTHTL